MKLNIGLNDQQREGVAQILNALLADEYVLYTKTRNHHWNITGPHFSTLHALFQTQYEELDDIIDEVAERVRALGGPAAGTLTEFLKLARLKEHSGQKLNAQEMIAALLADHEAVIRQLRSDLDACVSKHGDTGTSDFLTGLMEKHEKTGWMLRSTLEPV
jgi:starvation-inducible DNA-binding protein